MVNLFSDKAEFKEMEEIAENALTFEKFKDDVDEGSVKYELQAIGPVSYHVAEKTPYSFRLFAVYNRRHYAGVKVITEMVYDLREKRAILKRNNREVKFNIGNLDLIVPRERENFSSNEFETKTGAVKFFHMVEVQENKGMYQDMMKIVGGMGDERVLMTSRALVRIMGEYNKLELLLKAEAYESKMAWFRPLVYYAGQHGHTKIHEIYEMTKPQYKLLRTLYPNSACGQNMYRIIKKFKGSAVQELQGTIAYIKKLEEEYNLPGRLNAVVRVLLEGVEIKEGLNRYTTPSQVNAHHSRNSFHGLQMYLARRGYKVNFNKVIEYLLFECYVSQGMEFDPALTEYADYLRMNIDLGYENFEKYPKYLRTMHDIASMNYKESSSEIDNARFSEEVEAYAHLSHVGAKYSLIVPEEAKALSHEGNALHHCVGSYIRQVREGTTKILFMRENGAEDVPLVTVEINDNRIVQARGNMNRLLTSSEKTGLEKYAKEKELEITASI